MATRPDPVEESLVRDYPRAVWNKLNKALREYRMLREGQRIAVCVSGGPASLMLALCMQRLRRYGYTPFEAVFVHISDDGHDVEALLAARGIALTVLPGVPSEDSLLRAAKSLGCDTIALGHCFDDVIETVLGSVLYTGHLASILPKGRSEAVPDVEIIRPLCLVRASDILDWRDRNALPCVPAARMTPDPAQRAATAALLARLRERSTAIDRNIFRSLENVNLRTLLSYELDGVRRDFLADHAAGITNHGTRAGEGRR